MQFMCAFMLLEEKYYKQAYFRYRMPNITFLDHYRIPSQVHQHYQPSNGMHCVLTMK